MERAGICPFLCILVGGRGEERQMDGRRRLNRELETFVQVRSTLQVALISILCISITFPDRRVRVDCLPFHGQLVRAARPWMRPCVAPVLLWGPGTTGRDSDPAQRRWT